MKPYFENDSVTLYRGDCREVLPELTGTVNLLLTDPPYSRVKSDGWDRCSHLELETLLRDVFTAILPKMAKNGAVYCFCWPYFSARLQMLMADYFNVLNEIVWMKRRLTGAYCGYQAKASLESLRKFFSETERIVFAEMLGSDASASANAGYQDASAKLWAELMRPLIDYFAAAKQESGLSIEEIRNRMFELTGNATFSRGTHSAPPNGHFRRGSSTKRRRRSCRFGGSTRSSGGSTRSSGGTMLRLQATLPICGCIHRFWREAGSGSTAARSRTG